MQRKYDIDNHIEVEWLAGPLPNEDEAEVGTEVIMVYGNAKSVPNEEKQEFFTDSNGRQMMRRLQDTRFSYDLEGTVNYFTVLLLLFNTFIINCGVFVGRKSGALLAFFTQIFSEQQIGKIIHVERRS